MQEPKLHKAGHTRNGKCKDDNISNTYGRSTMTPRRSTTTARSFIATAESTAACKQKQ